MSDNKNMNTPENEEIVEVKEEKIKAEKVKKEKVKKPKLLKNSALLKRGGYAVAITAAVLAGLIVLNVLVGLLAKRFNLEFDMSTNKINTIDKENVEYIKKVKTPVEVIFCADAANYTGGYMSYYAQQYSVDATGAEAYFEQTIKLVDKYANYNKNINVRYIDPQDTAFTEISTKYAGDQLGYGSIIVSNGDKENERYKVIGFTDIYSLADESGYAAQGYGGYTIGGNNIETALTSAIVYVTNEESKKVGILTGHSANNYYDDYVKTLKTNNFEVEVIDSQMIGKIPEDIDTLLLVAPTTDFLGSELDIISEFLDNNGQLGRGLVFFADATAPYLPNLYDFLAQWGISVGEGILFDTGDGSHLADKPTTLGVFMADSNDYCITGYNVPIKAAFESEGGITVTALMETAETVVNAPVGSGDTWGDAANYEKSAYAGVIEAKLSDYNDDNEAISSSVVAFSSIEYIYSDYAEESRLYNKNISLTGMEKAAGVVDTGISFISKTITNESFASSVTQTGANVVRAIFVVILPIAIIGLGIFIFIRRKNA